MIGWPDAGVSNGLRVSASDGRTLTWAEYGEPDGVPVVLLHGTPGGRLGPARLGATYQDLGLRVLAPDRAGYGGSDPNPGRTVYSNAVDVLTVMDAAKVDRAFVVGGSGGGPHALALAAAASARVRAVGVLVGSAPLAEDEFDGLVAFNRRVTELIHDVPALTAFVEDGRLRALEGGLQVLLSDAPVPDRQTMNGQAARMKAAMDDAIRTSSSGWVDDYLALKAAPFGFDPAQVQRPVLWVHGLHDRNVPHSAARRYADQLPDCEFVTTEGGHLVSDQDTAQFIRALMAREPEGESSD